MRFDVIGDELPPETWVSDFGVQFRCTFGGTLIVDRWYGEESAKCIRAVAQRLGDMDL